MRFTQRQEGDQVIFTLSGQLLGGVDAEAICAAAMSAIQKGARIVVLNMEEVTWVNSTGLGTLISCHLAAKKNRAAFRLAGVSKRIGSILSITRLNTIFEVFETEDEARRAAAPFPSAG